MMVIDDIPQEGNIELEEQDGGINEGVKPWDPDLIRIATMVFSLFQVIDQIKDGDIDLAPDFQRQYVWKEKQKSRLIESVLLGIPLPSFYFNQDKRGRMQVVDGVQRLSTILAFREDKFALSDVEYLDTQLGKKFSELDGTYRRRFKNTQIYVNVIDPQTPQPVKFDVFKRINTGGSPLNPQEIRHCIAGPKTRDFLKFCAEEPVLHQTTGNTLLNHPRMGDREVVLRFCAFLLSEDNYAQAENFDSFLTQTLDILEKSDDSQLSELHYKLVGALRLAQEIFGPHAFRKWPLGDERIHPLNKSLFEAWTVVLTEYPPDDILAARSRIAQLFREALDLDQAFMSSISQATGGPRKVERRFAKVRSIVAEALNA